MQFSKKKTKFCIVSQEFLPPFQDQSSLFCNTCHKFRQTGLKFLGSYYSALFKIRNLCLIKRPTLQNLSYFWHMKSYVHIFLVYHLSNILAKKKLSYIWKNFSVIFLSWWILYINAQKISLIFWSVYCLCYQKIKKTYSCGETR